MGGECTDGSVPWPLQGHVGPRYKRSQAAVAARPPAAILTSAWHILTTGQPYTELGGAERLASTSPSPDPQKR